MTLLEDFQNCVEYKVPKQYETFQESGYMRPNYVEPEKPGIIKRNIFYLKTMSGWRELYSLERGIVVTFTVLTTSFILAKILK